MENQIEIYQSPEGIQVSVMLENDTVWLNRQQLALVFDRDIKTIGKHINNVFKEGELDPNSTVAKNAIVQIEAVRTVSREIEYFNLDAILSVGYRVNSKRSTQFRHWATQRQRDYLVKIKIAA
ncbi:MAG: virulence RhuM family protein [Chitinophagaceae bacterium]|nr:virulence RhuM family protein [Chitinophagaceae bacterium]